jgi:hypothetical protein
VSCQDMQHLSSTTGTPADTSLDFAIRTLWTDALLTIMTPSFHEPLAVIRHDFIVKQDKKQ